DPGPTPFPYTTLFRSRSIAVAEETEDGRLLATEQPRVPVELDLVTAAAGPIPREAGAADGSRHLKGPKTQRPGWMYPDEGDAVRDRKSTRLNSSHEWI